MAGNTNSFISRHRSSVLFTASVIGSGYLLATHIFNKLSQTRKQLGSDRHARENLRRRFEQNQSDCAFTVLGLIATASESISRELPVEAITAELQRHKAEKSSTNSRSSQASDGTGFPHEGTRMQERTEITGRKSKAQLWSDLKFTSLTRTLTLLYLLPLLVFLTRIQLNILGRQNYITSVLNSAKDNDSDTSHVGLNPENIEVSEPDFETSRMFLSFSWWLLHEGWKPLTARIRSSVEEVFGGVNPRSEVSLSEVQELMAAVRSNLECDARGLGSWSPYILPSREKECSLLSAVRGDSSNATDQEKCYTTSGLLRIFLDETSDLIESPVGLKVLQSLIDCNFKKFFSKLAHQAFDAGSLECARDPETRSMVRFATVLAAVARQFHYIGDSINNDYLEVVENDLTLQAFSAVIYSNYHKFSGNNSDAIILDQQQN